MKKIFTVILVAAGTIGSTSAQSINQKSIVYNDHSKMRYGHVQKGSYGTISIINYKDAHFSFKAKEAKLEMVNHDYDKKIAFVTKNWHLKSWQKSKQIQSLQNQRKNEISKVELQYAKSHHNDISKISVHDSHKW